MEFSKMVFTSRTHLLFSLLNVLFGQHVSTLENLFLNSLTKFVFKDCFRRILYSTSVIEI